MSLISLFAGLFLVELLLPSFSAIVGNTLTTSYFSSYLILPGILGFALLVGIISGSYPAFFLSAFRPTQALKGAVSRGAKSGLLRNSLVIFQFATSIALIVGTFIIKEQVDFLLNKDLGYDKDHIVVLQGAAALDQQVDIFKNELNKHANIVSSAGSFTYPGQARDGVTFRPRGATLDQAISISDIFVDFDYVQTMGLQLIDGRDFSREMASDSMGLILNETAYKSLNLDNPVGKQLTDGSDDSYFNIIGIMKDFHFKSLHNDITPAQLNLIGNGRANFLAVRIRPAGTTETIAYIERTWNEFTGGSPFLYEFLDENIREAYRAEQKTGQISSLFSVLAIGIGCLGLLGLAAFTAEQRTKEIGVRKVLGATVTNVVFLLSEEFIKLVGLAFVFAVPLSYYLMSRWLDNFAYSTNVSIMTFVFAGILTLIIALLTVSYQVIKAANQDPVRSLRAE